MLDLVVVVFVVAVAAEVVAGGDGGDVDGFRVEVECSLMWVFHNFQKLGGNFVVWKIYSHWNLRYDDFSC